VAQQHKAYPGCLIVEVSKSHTIRLTQTHPVGLLSISDQPVAEAATYKTHSKHNRRTSVLSVGIESTIPAVKRRLTYATENRI